MFKYLHDQGWLRDPEISAADLPAVVQAQAHFGTCLKSALGDRSGRRSEQEMTTMAEALNHILRGEVVRGLEVLMQRFKALEARAYSIDWEEASQYELVPKERVSCISLREQELARASLMQERSLATSRGSFSGGAPQHQWSPRRRAYFREE